MHFLFSFSFIKQIYSGRFLSNFPIQKVIEKFHIYVDKAPKRPHGVGEGKVYFFYAYYRSKVRAKAVRKRQCWLPLPIKSKNFPL